MIDLPDFKSSFEYENNYFLSCNPSRIAKLIAHYNFFEKTKEIEGSIVECGVFKGSSLSRFAMFRKMLNLEYKKIVGFDTFSSFPETKFEQDKDMRSNFINIAGQESISVDQLLTVLEKKKCDNNIELIEGDITQTVPKYVENNCDLRISLINLDVDIFEPTEVILKHFYPRLSFGGIMILDDYKKFKGETVAVDDYFKDKNITIQKPIYPNTPHYIIK